MQEMQSQQAWIISQHLASPLVQVIATPSLVISQWHIPMVMLQQQTIIPFIRQQQLHIPPASMVHRFCTMPHAIWSSQEQTIFMPPLHFSALTVHRGTIIQFIAAGIPAGVPTGLVPMPGIPIAVRSIIMLDILAHSFLGPKDPLAPAEQTQAKPEQRGSRRDYSQKNAPISTIFPRKFVPMPRDSLSPHRSSNR
jgi:hypothetical protein